MPRYASDQERITRNVLVDGNGCWLWLGCKTEKGYGLVNKPGHGKYRAHRFSYETFVGPIPEGLVLDHLCRARACVRPDHLEPVTDLENKRRSPYFRRLHDLRVAKRAA